MASLGRWAPPSRELTCGGNARRSFPRTLVEEKSLKLSLIPRPSEFYDLFTEDIANALEAARQTEARFRGFPGSAVSHAEIKEIEHAGDRLTRDLFHLLNTQYVTPFDREDIFGLATAIDDVVDTIEHASDLLDLYGVESVATPAIQQCQILVAAVEELASAVGKLKGLKNIQPALIEVHRLEDEGDRVVRDAIAELFQEGDIDPLVVIRWKDIFEALEDAIDACETAANVIGNIFVKNA